MKRCMYCNKEEDDLYMTDSKCDKNCKNLELCLDCLDLNDKNCLKCEKEKKDKKEEKKIEKKIDTKPKTKMNGHINNINNIDNNNNKNCEKCLKENKNLKIWKYDNCNNKKNHSTLICQNCRQASFKKLNNGTNCYYCGFKFINEKEKIVSKFQKCNENHEIDICIFCINFFNLLQVFCDICYEVQKEHCYFCNIESSDNMNLNGYGCAKEYTHNYRTCIDCLDFTDNISNNFSCKICLNKKSKEIIFFKNCLTDISIYEGFIGLKIFSNDIGNSNYFDYLNCNKCYKEMFKKFYIERNFNQFEDYNTLPGSSVCEVKLNNEITYILTGGFSIKNDCFESQKQILFVKFEKINKFKYYVNKIFEEVYLEESRYFHKSIYLEEKKLLISLGGISFKDGFIKFLDTIEILELNDNYNLMSSSKKIKTKMMKPRHSFSALNFKNKIIYFGGYNNEEKLEVSMEVFDFELETVAKLKFKQPLNYKFLGGSNLLKWNESQYLIFGGTDTEKGNKMITKMDLEKKVITKEKLKLNHNIFNAFSLTLKDENNEENLIIISGKNDLDDNNNINNDENINDDNLLIQKGKLSNNLFNDEVLDEFFYEDDSNLKEDDLLKLNSKNLNLMNISEIKYNIKV